MKKFVCIAVMALGAAGVAQNTTSQSSQSLGDVARKTRTEEKAPAKKVYTDDDFAPQPAPAPAPAAETKAADTAPSAEEATKAANPREKGQDSVDLSKETGATSDSKDKKDAKPKEKDAKAAEDDQAKMDAEWKSKIDAQKAKIAGMQREYDLTDREYKLFATTFYADAGNRLRDQKDFTEKETGYRDKLGSLKQQITDEQAKLTELQDQAHKAGANKAYD